MPISRIQPRPTASSTASVLLDVAGAGFILTALLLGHWLAPQDDTTVPLDWFPALQVGGFAAVCAVICHAGAAVIRAVGRPHRRGD